MNKIEVSININPQKVYIENYIAENKRHLIQRLKIIGPFYTWDDCNTIRQMCNTTNDDSLRGQLEVLDLIDAAPNGSLHFYKDSLKDCVTLREIVFGKSLKEIYGNAMDGCLSLEKIEVKDNSNYISIDGILYRQVGDGNLVLIKVPAAIKDSTIPFEKINSIEEHAFVDTSITSLVMPDIPPILNGDVFGKTDISKITLFVPASSFNNYWLHPIWGQFNIQIRKD